jgi:hypothetical protein
MFAMTGCSSFDDDVFPHVVTATVTTVPSQPDSLAAVNITLRIEAGPSAERRVALGRVSLEQQSDQAFVRELALVFPDEPTLAFHANEARTVDLVNLGTTNADLTPLCGEAFQLSVLLDYPDSASEWTGGGASSVAITCL